MIELYELRQFTAFAEAGISCETYIPALDTLSQVFLYFAAQSPSAIGLLHVLPVQTNKMFTSITHQSCGAIPNSSFLISNSK